jgi:hypothetical protein
MTARATDHDRAVRFYARLVALYPTAHRAEYGPQMQHTFEDSYRHATEGERRAGVGFWLTLLWDEGCSVVRERAAEPQGESGFFALVFAWGLALVIVPTIPAASDWRNLVLPTGILAVLFLTLPGHSQIARRLATVVVVLAVVECVAWAAQSINDQTQIKDQTHLLAPVLFVAGMAFSIKTLQGLNARIIGMKDSVWGREEVTYGGLVGLVGMMGLGFSVVDRSDTNPVGPFLVLFVVPLACAVAGFKSSRRNRSLRCGVYAALGSMLIGATIWILAEPLLVEGALLTFFRDHPVPAATLLPYWGVGPILFLAASIGVAGAIFGLQGTNEDVTDRQTTS